MQFSIIFVFALLAHTGFAAPNAKRTIKQVELDIATISTRLDALNAATAQLSTNKKAIELLEIGTDIQDSVHSLESAIKAGTTDVKATQTPVSESDGQAVSAAIQNLLPKITGALNKLVAKKPALTGLSVPGVSALAHQDLTDLHASADLFATALIAVAPADIKPTANTVKSSLDAAFAAAVAAYP